MVFKSNLQISCFLIDHWDCKLRARCENIGGPYYNINVVFFCALGKISLEKQRLTDGRGGLEQKYFYEIRESFSFHYVDCKKFKHELRKYRATRKISADIYEKWEEHLIKTTLRQS